ncbi:toll/interleukin-1 receptor domain-containing protein [Listeria grandensis]|uniref:toll/interleukin-1 receptor domain-containing protein n=1 Tax=Listeria grandensis TaxID=1494963 RepID=UPI001629D650|nr:toll/interleukin-1 receptor domain-containing protein [Listeria grandensis]MBC1473284.1 toll/interleukin-1 receptor domain-containing protein [Listeria grandensis]
MDNKPAVTIVYSWDDTGHKEWVKNLATELESNGVEVTYDQKDLSLGDDLNQFMELAVDSASIILAVCSEEYKKKIDHRDGGSGYEGRMIAEKVKDKSATIIPII